MTTNHKQLLDDGCLLIILSVKVAGQLTFSDFSHGVVVRRKDEGQNNPGFNFVDTLVDELDSGEVERLI